MIKLFHFTCYSISKALLLLLCLCQNNKYFKQIDSCHQRNVDKKKSIFLPYPRERKMPTEKNAPFPMQPHLYEPLPTSGNHRAALSSGFSPRPTWGWSPQTGKYKHKSICATNYFQKNAPGNQPSTMLKVVTFFCPYSKVYPYLLIIWNRCICHIYD